MPPALGVPGGHRGAVQCFVKRLSWCAQKGRQVRDESLQEVHVGAHQPIKLRALGQGGEGISQPSLGVAVEVPLARETAPTGKDGQGNHLALGEGGLWAGPLFRRMGVAEVVCDNVEYGEEGVHIEHEASVPFPSGSVSKPTLANGHLPLKSSPDNSHQAFKSLSAAHVQGFYRDRLDSGLSPATVQKIHAVLHKALDQAASWSLVPRNPTESVKAPRPAPGEIRPLNREQAKALLETARRERFEALYVLAVTTGLRQGELLGLKWEDVDLENSLIRVRRTLIRNRGRLLLGEPKTKRSRRTVRLTEAAVQALKEYLARQIEQMERLGDLYEDQGLIFATQRGTLVNPTNLRKRSFAPLLEKAGLPPIRFHDLRHTCATLLLSRNVNLKIVSEMLGHATIAITLDTYSHVLPTMQDSATRALEDALR